jgi:CheY-like chemotaxis protein
VDDGHAAWEAVRKSPIDGLVLASHLPGRDGLSVMRLCRNHPDLESLPVWMLDTGLSASERRLASELGAVVVADASGADMLRDLVLYRLVPRRAAAP